MHYSSPYLLRGLEGADGGALLVLGVQGVALHSEHETLKSIV